MPRVKPHAKLHCSLGNHAKTASMYADNDMLALYCRILITATERYADRHGNSFNVHRSEICQLTGKGRRDVAAKSLERLADVSPISASPDGDMWVIHVPNFLTKQGFNPKKGDRREDPPTTAPTTTPTPRTTPLSSRENGKTENGTSCPEPPKPKKKLEPPSHHALWLSAILKRGILQVPGWENCNVPKAKAPIAWARTFDQMMSTQGRDYERIQAVIVWLYTDNRSMEEGKVYTIQSADSLNTKFDLVEDMIAKTSKPDAKRAAREKREQEEADQRQRERDAVTREREENRDGVMAGDVLKGMKLEVTK